MVDFFYALSLIEQITFGVILLTLLYQVILWMGFSVIATHRHHSRLAKDETPPPISVIVIVGEESQWYIDNELEKLLTQQYDALWEVVVVNDCGGVEVSSALDDMKARYDKLQYTELRKDPKFPHSRKVPLFIGVKKAKYENLLFADINASVRSQKWLSVMARGFVGGNVVIGYTGFDAKTNGFIRSSRLMSSMRWLRDAVNDKPYRGIYNNYGYTKTTFFGSKGFSHLRLSIGEDDLFVQKVAKRSNVSVILNPLCTVEQHPYGGVGWWWNEQRYRSYAFKFYPSRVKRSVFLELFTKTLFLLAIALTPILSFVLGGWEYMWAVGAGAFLLREWSVVWSVRRVMKRLGEKRMMFVFLIYELLNPITETILAISRRVKVNSELWKY